MISISLPSLYPDCLDRAMRNIRDATRSDYRVVVVSPFRPALLDEMSDRVEWIEEGAGAASGCNAGHAAAYAAMRGEFVTPWVDDHHYVDGWDVMILRAYAEREALFHAASPGAPFSLGLRHLWPHHVGTQFGMHYPYFPFMRREYTDAVGWFDPAYRKGFADGDMAMRVWASGGRCEWADRGTIVVTHEDDRKAGVMYEPEDMRLFVERWAPRYGGGWSVGHIRDFNIDVEPQNFPDLVDGNTIVHNAPDFRDRVLAGGWRP